MAKLSVLAQSSSNRSEYIYIQDSAGAGKTGITYNAAGLTAYYVRPPVLGVGGTATLITLVSQTTTGAWTSGGWVEVDATNLPGVYRFDVPNAVFATGVDHVTVIVKGASGMLAVALEYQLTIFDPATSWLTAAQTAQAVLDAVASTHNNIGSIGAFIQDKTGYSLSTSQTFNTTGSVGSVTGNVTGNVTGTVGGVVGNIVGNLTGSVGTVATPDNIIDGVWDEQRVGHTASGSFGEKLQTNAMADEMLARDLGSGLNAGTAEERTVRSALRALRNKVNVGSSQMVVKKEDDTTDAWTASVTTTAVSSNVSGIDPN